ncbi:MAG: hypothetical protein GY945_02485 [Rhodobacteraceae bacterium]|nr:hypothetical protein [Paracoccaceae bacterium]
MKKTLLAATIAMTASNAFAGSAVDPNMDVTIITQDVSSAYGQQWLVPAVFVFLLVLLMGAANKPCVECEIVTEFAT